MKDIRNISKPLPRITEHSGIPQKARGADLRADYPITLQLSFATALLVLIGMTYTSFDTGGDFHVVVPDQEVVEIEEIRQTQQIEQPPPPPRPPVPIEVPNDQILENDFLDLDASLDLNEPASYIPAPPPPAIEEVVEEEEEAEIFVVVEEMPEMIGGTAHLNSLVKYPELARKAGMEGLVVIKVVVEPDGSVSSPTIMRSAGDLLDQAALNAVMQVRFKPGLQRGQPVRVSFAVPVRFRLRDA